MTVNMTLLEESNSMLNLVGFVNDNSGGIFIVLLLLAVFFILFMNLRKNGALDAILVSAFPCFLLSLLFKSLGLINFMFVILFFVIIAFSVVYKFLQE